MLSAVGTERQDAMALASKRQTSCEKCLAIHSATSRERYFLERLELLPALEARSAKTLCKHIEIEVSAAHQ